MSININEYASVDCLTNLYNRSYGIKSIDKLIRSNKEFSVFYIDLNKFKIVNDLYGHDVGDLVLKEVGSRFKSLEKEDLLFARLGGDEFIAIYGSIDENEVNNLGKSIDKILEESIVISESEFPISASIGVARYPIDSDNIDDLLKLADMAMYKAKESGSNNKYLITDELNKKLETKKNIENSLKKIDIENDLFLEYQPIFNLKTGKVTSVEVLVRWNHETEGIVYPNDFIYVAEEMDIVKDITKCVFVNSFKQIGLWNQKYGTNYKISLNVADSCIHNKIFFANVKYMMKIFKVKPEWLSLELSELSISVSPLFMKELLCSINEIGIDIQLDKFGTHPILIPDLKKYKIKEIKIDKRYIDKLDSEEGISIVKSIIMFAKGLGIKTIAMGVEKEDQYNTLKKLNCDKIQGFFLERPMSQKALEKKYFENKVKLEDLIVKRV